MKRSILKTLEMNFDFGNWEHWNVLNGMTMQGVKSYGNKKFIITFKKFKTKISKVSTYFSFGTRN